MTIGGFQENLYIMMLLLGIAFVFSLIVLYLCKRRIFPAILTMSILSNLIFYGDVSALFYSKWFVVFTINYWPWLNLALFIILIVVFVRRKLISKND